MSDDITVTERYMTARTTSSLKVQERTTMSASDILAAAGMAGHKHSLALQLWAVSHQPSRHQVHSLSDLLSFRLEAYMLSKKMKHREKCRAIAKQVLLWWIHGVCKACDGTKEQRIENTPHLSGVACPECHGTGKVELKTSNNEAAHWLAQEIDSLALSAETAIRRHLK